MRYRFTGINRGRVVLITPPYTKQGNQKVTRHQKRKHTDEDMKKWAKDYRDGMSKDAVRRKYKIGPAYIAEAIAKFGGR